MDFRTGLVACLHAQRLAQAHNQWRCQMCGEQLPERAWVLAAPSGAVLQAALHQECLDLAQKFCPHLSGGATRATARQITRGQLTAGGRPLPQAAPSDPDFLLQQWELTAAKQPLPADSPGPTPAQAPGAAAPTHRLTPPYRKEPDGPAVAHPR